MAVVRSLVDLCMAAAADELLDGDYDDYILSGVFQLPSELLDGIVMRLTPLALQKLQLNWPFDLNIISEHNNDCHHQSRKRKRYGILDVAWCKLYKVRWPRSCLQRQAATWSGKSDNSGEESVDSWQQMYWEAHLQDCVDAVAETALLPSYDGSIGEIKIPGGILQLIGCKDHQAKSISRYLEFSYHCFQFGTYSRHMRLSNALCTAETCELLQKSKLVSLEIHWIKSNDNVEGLCKLLDQNSETLKSVYFMHCKLSPSLINAICISLQMKGRQLHGVDHFTIKRSSFCQTNASSMPLGFASFLSSGKHSLALTLCDVQMGQHYARETLDCLLAATNGIYALDLSENNISGFLCHLRRRSSPLPGVGSSLLSLRDLNLRGCNLEKDDIYCLKHILLHLPNLENLDLSDNLIEDGIRTLIFYFTEMANRDLRFSDLKLDNCDLTCNQVTELLEALSNLKKPLNLLSIKGNRLGSQFGSRLGKFLCTGIGRLDVEDVGLGSSGFSAATKEITKELEIVNINISNNQGGIEAAHFVSILVAHAHKIHTVYASYNSMPVEALSVLSDGLKTSKGKLEYLDLSGNLFSRSLAGMESILAEIQMHTPCTLNISLFDGRHETYDNDP